MIKNSYEFAENSLFPKVANGEKYDPSKLPLWPKSFRLSTTPDYLEAIIGEFTITYDMDKARMAEVYDRLKTMRHNLVSHFFGMYLSYAPASLSLYSD